MITRQVNGETWYIVAVHYPTAAAARQAWERAERAPWRPSAAIGLIRMSAQTHEFDPACPAGRHPVVGVTVKRASAEDMEDELADGTPWAPGLWFQDQLIERRRKVVTAFGSSLQGTGGRYRVRRPER